MRNGWLMCVCLNMLKNLFCDYLVDRISIEKSFISNAIKMKLVCVDGFGSCNFTFVKRITCSVQIISFVWKKKDNYFKNF